MKVFTGLVISTKMNKTATIAVERLVAHPVYKKMVKKIKKYQVHDELGVKVGDRVSFVGSRPFSKSVKWQITKIASLPTAKNKLVKVAKVKKGEKKV
jgi:small subunit ribosomal protein S17